MAGDPRERAAERLVALISPPGEHEVLDVGTGGGFLARKLAAAGFRVLGIDVDADAIAGATKEPAPGDRLRFEVADVHGLAEGKRRWLTIVASYVLHECDDPIATLRSICACLQPGGRLACMDFAPNCAAYLSGVGRTPFHAFRALAKGDWQGLAPAVGLSLSEQLCFGYVSVTLARKQPDGDGRTAMTRGIGETIP
jgi:SAM-dependent methyltransferase